MALTTEEQEAANLGFAMPEGSHFIRNGDDAIRRNALTAIKYARTAGIVESVPPGVTSFNSLLNPGDYQLYGNADAARIALDSWPPEFQEGKLPRTAANITVRKPSPTNFAWQTLRVFFSGRNKEWKRQTKSYNATDMAFGPWEEVVTVPPQEAPKAAVVNLSTPVKNYYENAAAMNHRVPFRLPTRVTRYRLHIAARNDASAVEISDPELRINRQPVIGKHKLENGQFTGQFAEVPFPAAPVYSIPLPDGKEWVGDWVNLPLEANTDYLLSFSYYNPNKVEIPSGMGGSYIQAATGWTDKLDTPGINYYFKTPFALWLEVEVAHDVPTIGFIGDSLMVGRDSACPLYESPAWLRGRREGFLPRMHAIAGGRMSLYNSEPEAPRWSRYAALGKCDAAVIQIGSNDFFDQTGLATAADIVAEMKTRLEQTVTLARRWVADEVYYCTILPRNNATYNEKVKSALREYNEWLQTLPFGARGCYDWAGAIGTADRDSLLARYVAADKVHLTSAGYTAVSGAPLANRPALTVPTSDSRIDDLLRRVAELEARL